MYQPTLARFLSRDPLPENGTQILYPFPDTKPSKTLAPIPSLASTNTPSHSDLNLYRYVWNNPVVLFDPSGLKCEVAVHWRQARAGSFPVGTHAGLTIIDNTGTYRIDGSAGNICSVDIVPGTDPNNNLGPFKSYPDSVCKCLRIDYPALFNPLRIPRTNLEGNSNWTLYCTVTHCGISINWGNISTPIGYRPEGACKKEMLYIVPVADITYGCSHFWVCVEHYTCP
jgi:hypothetical protein